MVTWAMLGMIIVDVLIHGYDGFKPCHAPFNLSFQTLLIILTYFQCGLPVAVFNRPVGALLALFII